MSNNGDCDIHLLKDDPATEDSFGSHSELAAAIGTTVERESSAQTVALLGPFGSGKSTIVRLLATKFASDDDVALWVFDAWAHEGNPLRREFLEALVAFLAGRQWIDSQVWNEQMLQFTRRRKQSTTRTLPRLSVLGWILTSSFLVVPIGNALFQRALATRTLTVRWSLGSADGLAISGLLLLLAPAITVVLAAISFLLLRRLRPEKPSGSADPIAEVFALFVQKAVTTQDSEVLETPEPSSVEFERAFRLLLKECLANTNRRLIVVIDNLDRLSAESAVSLWSTLQTFSLLRERQLDGIGRMWLLVPVDKSALTKTLSKNENGSSQALAVLEKSFQLAVDVPSPALSNWREFLISALRQSLPTHAGESDTFEVIYRLVAGRRLQKRGTRANSIVNAASMSPRAVKRFVNRLALVHRQNRHRYPLSHEALFVLLREDDVDIPDQIRAGSAIQQTEFALLGNDVADNVAAMHFGVPVAQARYLLVEDAMVKAMLTGEGSVLRSLSERIDGFEAVLEHALNEVLINLSEHDHTRVLMATAALAESGFLNHSTASQRRMWLALLTHLTKADGEYSTLDDSAALGLAHAAARVDDQESARRIVNRIQNLVKLVSSRDEAGDQTNRLTKRLVAFATRASHAFSRQLSQGVFSIDGGRRPYESAVRALEQAKVGRQSRLWELFSPTRADVVAELIEAVHAGQIATNTANVVLALNRSGSLGEVSSIVDSVVGRLQGAAKREPAEVNRLCAVISTLRDTAAAQEASARMASDGSLGHHMYAAAEAKDDRALLRLVLLQLDHSDDLKSVGQIGNFAQGFTRARARLAAPDTELFEALRDVLSEDGRFADLIKAAETDSHVRTMTSAYLQSELAASAEHVPSAGLLADSPRLFARLSPTYLDAIADSRSELRSRLSSVAFDIGHMAAIEAILTDPDGFRDSSFTFWLTSGLRELGAADWASALRDDSVLLAVAHDLGNHGVRLDLGHEFASALRVRLSSLVTSDETDSVSNAVSDIELLNEGHRESIADHLVQVVVENGDVSELFLTTAMAQFARSRVLAHDTRLLVSLIDLLGHKAQRVLAAFIEAMSRERVAWYRDLDTVEKRLIREALASALGGVESPIGLELKSALNSAGVRLRS